MKKFNIKLPKWPFYALDGVFLAVAIIILLISRDNLTAIHIFWSVLCVCLGAGLFATPYIMEYRDKVAFAMKEKESAIKNAEREMTAILAEFNNENDRTLELGGKFERRLMVFESLLKRMEVRLQDLDLLGQHQKIRDIEKIPVEDQGTLIKFEETDQEDQPPKSPTKQANPHPENITHIEEKVVEGEELIEDEEPHEEAEDDHEVDIHWEMDGNFIDDNEETAEDQEHSNSGLPATVIANVMMGIGSRPYIRGEGPGLSWEKGTPMEFLSLGKWQWKSDPSERPITFQIYKNDEIAAEGQNFTLNPGDTSEIQPKFN